MPKKQKFFRERKKVSQKVYERRLQLVEIARNSRGSNGEFKSPNLRTDNNTSETASNNIAKGCIDDDNNFVVAGRRIVHLKTLANQLFCKRCEYLISLMDIREEKRFELGSILYIKCCQCKLINTVHTDKQHRGCDNKLLSDTNMKAVVGCLNNDTGNTHFDELLARINIPELTRYTYKPHRNEVAIKVGDVARENCLDAAMKEKELTIKHAEKLKDLL